MFIHMFAFRFKPDVTSAQKERVLEEIRTLKDQIPEILESWVGFNVSPRGHGYEFGGAMKFPTQPRVSATTIIPSIKSF